MVKDDRFEELLDRPEEFASQPKIYELLYQAEVFARRAKTAYGSDFETASVAALISSAFSGAASARIDYAGLLAPIVEMQAVEGCHACTCTGCESGAEVES